MKILHISDTHAHEKLLNIPENIDMIIHSGDFSNYKEVYKNEMEAREFLHWYSNRKIKYKLLIAGNHDAFAAKMSKEFRDLCKFHNIIYLENELIEIEGLNIYGSPLQPSFHDWYFQKPRHKLDRYWKEIPNNTNILIVHGPPQGILDLALDKNGNMEYCGCKALRNNVNRIKPKLVCFGHIHNNNGIINAGTRTVPHLDTLFSNGSVVTDGKFGTLSSNGNIIEL